MRRPGAGPIQIRPGDAGGLIVLLPYTQERVAKIKTVPGRRWHQGEKYWTVPHNATTLAQLLALFAGEAIAVDPSLPPLSVPDNRGPSPEPVTPPSVPTIPKLLDQVRQAIRSQKRGHSAFPSRYRRGMGIDQGVVWAGKVECPLFHLLKGGGALAVRCDVTRAEDVKAALAKTVEAFGRLDFAFNNAGIEPRKPAPTAEYEEEEWNRIIDTNLRGVFLCMKHEIPLILKQGGGAIVNTSSGAGIIGIKGSPAYTAAKHGVIGLTRAAALDYAAQNIRVNAVCPGYIDTPMMGRFTGGTPEGRAKVIAEEPVGRMGKPEEIAAAVIWLCSDAAAFMVGHAMVIDGGQTVQ